MWQKNIKSRLFEFIKEYATKIDWKIIWRTISTSKLVQDAGKLLALNFLGRIIAFFSTTYAMRSLGPEQLGIGSFVIATVAQGAVLGDFGLNISGVRSLVNVPDKKDETVSIIWGLRFRIGLFIASFMFLGVIVFHPVGSLSAWLMAIPLLIISVLSPQWIFQGIERVPIFNGIQLLQTAAAAILYFGLFQTGVQADLYIAVALCTQLMTWAISIVILRRWVRISWLKFDARKAIELIRQSRYLFGFVLTVFVYGGLEIPLITLLLSPDDAGVYRAAQGIAGIILPILSILPLLIYPRLIAWRNDSNQKFHRNALILIFGLSVLAMVLIGGATITVPIIFQFLLGENFETGILPCIVLFIAKGFILIGAVPAWGLLAYGLDKYQLIVSLVAAVTSITLNLLLIPHWGIVAVAAVNAISELIVLVLSTTFLLSFLNKELGEIQVGKFNRES